MNDPRAFTEFKTYVFQEFLAFYDNEELNMSFIILTFYNIYSVANSNIYVSCMRKWCLKLYKLPIFYINQLELNIICSLLASEFLKILIKKICELACICFFFSDKKIELTDERR